MSYSIINQKAEKIAESIIDVIGIPEPSLEDVLKWFEFNFDYSFEIKLANLASQKLSGMVHGNGPAGSYKILINKDESIERQRFTLYHELGHLVQGEALLYGCFDGDVTNQKEEERFCNRFAAAMLMPQDSFRSVWNSTYHENKYIKRFVISERYGVSKRAVDNRARDLGLS